MKQYRRAKRLTKYWKYATYFKKSPMCKCFQMEAFARFFSRKAMESVIKVNGYVTRGYYICS